jgi:tetratricopeptide (TPR) repeat protein
MMDFAEYNARLCDKDLQEYFQYLLLERQEKPEDDTIKDTIAELQGIVMPGHLNGKMVIELREQNKIAADLAEQGKIKESTAIIQQILTIYSEHYSAFYTLGEISFNQGNYTNALDCFKQAFEINPFFTDAVLRIFDCSVYIGNTSSIIDIVNKALTLQPSDPELLEVKLHLEDGTYPQHITQSIAAIPEKDEIKKELLKIKEMLENGDLEAALEKLKTLV